MVDCTLMGERERSKSARVLVGSWHYGRMRKLFTVALVLASFSIALADSISSSQQQGKVNLAAPPLAEPFPLAAVRITGGQFKQGQDIAAKYLLSLEPDRFLANFRKDAGLEPRAKHYGGWEIQGVSGHSGGHYLSACAQAYAATGDNRFLNRVNYIVDELALCQEANTNGYVSAIPNGKKVYAEVSAGNIRSSGFDLNGCWVPNYTMHKVFAGLRDAYRLCGSVKALRVARGLADWFYVTFKPLTEEQMQRVLAAEHGGLNETFADLYADTGEARYLELARRFHHKAILDPLARGEDILPGKHANTQIPKLIGLATLYEIGGEAPDHKAADFFWDRVVNHHSYVTGGHCDHEHFGQPDRLNDRLSNMTAETCNVYNMLKLTRHVFGWRPQATVADFYERALLNHIRSTQHPDGRVIYNLSLKPGHHKEYQSPYDGFTCCVGTGFENHVKYAEGIYFHDDANLWVNLFIPSELHWADRGLMLRQETKWPNGDSSTLHLSLAKSSTFALRIRHPHWAKAGFTVMVNGKRQNISTQPSSYVEIRRKWKDEDRVEVRFPMGLRTEAMPDNPKRLAIFYGPTLLAANLGAEKDPYATDPLFVPVLLTQDRPVSEWVKPVAVEDLSFATWGVGRPRELQLTPFHSLHDRRYTVYVDAYTPEEFASKEAEIREMRAREARLAARTLDTVRIGEMQPERDHDLKGEHTSAGEAFGRKWRHATDGGWFSFDMKVKSGKPAELLCTYWGGDAGNRVFDILVNSTRIATQTLENNKPNAWMDVSYPIPADLTASGKVTVRFQAHPGKWAGGLYGARTLEQE